jgi:hypothetical protein
MQKLIFTALVAFGFGYTAQAQSVAINTDGTAADGSSILDVKATDKGVLIPRVALTATNTAAPVTSPATSLMVYNTNTAGDVTPGYYFWNGSAWVRVQTGTIPITSGGTGQTTANSALNALLPTQATHNGKVLQTDGTTTSWQTAGVPASGIIISETATNATLTTAGFTLIGSTTQIFSDLTPILPTWTATLADATAPVARRLHTAIWTGTEMIVWGGLTTSGYLNSGGKYDPLTNAWSATSTGGSVPSARGSHTAVWTGAEMIVWGGTNGPELATGGRYNPITNTWIATIVNGSRPPVTLHSAVWTGREMIVWGGSNAGTPYNLGSRYSPFSDSWNNVSSGPNAPAGRRSHEVVWTGTEMIVWGGENGPNLNTGGKYNPITDTWVPTLADATAPTARSSSTAVWTGTEMIIWGDGDNVGYKYNPAINTWTLATTTGAPTAKTQHSAVWTGIEMIIWGGSDNTGGRYNPTTNTWTATILTDAPTARGGHTVVWTGTEMIVWGGGTGAGLNTGGRLTNGGSSNKTLYYFKKN